MFSRSARSAQSQGLRGADFDGHYRPRRDVGRRRLSPCFQHSHFRRCRFRQKHACGELVDAGCRKGETALYFSFEESADQTVRNMRSVGLDLKPYLDSGKLRYIAARPTFYSLEMHLAIMLREVARFKPRLVVLDPISAFDRSGDPNEIQAMLLRMVDYLKSHGATAIFTNVLMPKVTKRKPMPAFRR